MSNLNLVFLQGALVANYPWDGSADKGTHYSECPDDAAYRHLALVYAGAHAKMGQSHEFQGGITNGAKWYPLWGGMQASAAHATLASVSSETFAGFIRFRHARSGSGRCCATCCQPGCWAGHAHPRDEKVWFHEERAWADRAIGTDSF